MKDPMIDKVSSTASQASDAAIIKTYVRQRFSLLTFGLLSIYLFLFINENIPFNAAGAIDLVFIALFLFTMRLYDDLQNIPFDLMTGRIYTDPAAAKTLKAVFLGAALCLVALASLVNPMSGALVLLFLVTNHTLYHLLVARSSWRYFLPLIKYTFLAGLISGGWSISHFALFFAFLTYDLIDDTTFPLPKWAVIITSMAAFGLVMSTVSAGHIFLAGIAAAIATPLAVTRTRYSAFAFLVILLLAKLIDPLYEI
jgi:hypothetical protein